MTRREVRIIRLGSGAGLMIVVVIIALAVILR